MAPLVSGVLASLAAAAAAASAAAAGSAAGSEASRRLDLLQERLQAVLDDVSDKHNGTPLQLGWKSASAEFALAAGRVPPRPGEGGGPGRPTTVTDTFLFGSGTKPLTAAAVMSLRDRGLLSLDDPLEQHVDPVLDRLQSGSTLQGLFGPKASRITVGHTLRMQSGVQDFDFPPFDNFLLRANETYRTHSPYEFVQYASTQQPPLLCDPGSCVSYSSNNFVLAGLILLAHANVTEWWQLDLPSLLPEGAAKSLRGLSFFQKEMLDTKLTVPGQTGGGWAKTPQTTIWNQSATILGWTCGNMVGTALDVATFLWGLLGPEAQVLPARTVEEMKMFQPLNLGWAAGAIQYGTGLMIESVQYTPGHPPKLPDWGTYMGHGGDTYGFLSEQGIISGLNASVSIVAAQDSDTFIVTQQALCRTIKEAAQVLAGVELSFPCMMKPPPVPGRSHSKLLVV